MSMRNIKTARCTKGTTLERRTGNARSDGCSSTSYSRRCRAGNDVRECRSEGQIGVRGQVGVSRLPMGWGNESRRLPTLREVFRNQNQRATAAPMESGPWDSSNAPRPFCPAAASNAPAPRPFVLSSPALRCVPSTSACPRPAPQPSPRTCSPQDGVRQRASMHNVPRQQQCDRRLTYDMPQQQQCDRRLTYDMPQEQQCDRRFTYDVPQQQQCDRRLTYDVPRQSNTSVRARISNAHFAYDGANARAESCYTSGGDDRRTYTFTFTGIIRLDGNCCSSQQQQQQQRQQSDRHQRDRSSACGSADEYMDNHLNVDMVAPRSVAVPGCPYVSFDEGSSGAGTPEQWRGGSMDLGPEYGRADDSYRSDLSDPHPFVMNDSGEQPGPCTRPASDRGPCDCRRANPCERNTTC